MSARRRFPISLTMIVRDEARVLARCLDSVTGLVDEIVIVDTGSVDDTVAIATSYGAKVHHFDWVDDFAAARNHALSHATHPWRLVLDADEWIVDREQASRVLADIGERKPAFVGSIDMFQVGPDGSLDDSALPQPLPRLLPPHVTFEGRVHEQPRPNIDTFLIGLLVGHDGYRDEAKARKEGRNADLLIAALEEDPGNAYLWYQLAAEFFVRGMQSEALVYLTQAYNLLHPAEAGPDAPLQAPWWHRVSMRLILALIDQDRLEEAVQVGELEASAWPESSDLFYVFGLAARRLALSLRASDPARAEDLALAATGLWTRAAELGDRQEFSGALTARATVLAAQRLVEDYEMLGNTAEADRYRRLVAGEQIRKAGV